MKIRREDRSRLPRLAGAISVVALGTLLATAAAAQQQDPRTAGSLWVEIGVGTLGSATGLFAGALVYDAAADCAAASLAPHDSPELAITAYAITQAAAAALGGRLRADDP
jgi:hypothetical protein